MGEVPLTGDDGVMIYQLHYVGGARDGSIVNSFRPYDAMKEADGFYVADAEGEACLIWVDDWTRKIQLRFKPAVKSFEELR